MLTIITVLEPSIFNYKIVVDDIDGYFNEKCTVAFREIEKGFRIEYNYENFADEGKYSFKVQMFQDFVPDNIKELIPMQIYLCYVEITETINKVSAVMFINIEMRPEIKVQTFEELKGKILPLYW